jgi:hypothetical protein
VHHIDKHLGSSATAVNSKVSQGLQEHVSLHQLIANDPVLGGLGDVVGQLQLLLNVCDSHAGFEVKVKV